MSGEYYLKAEQCPVCKNKFETTKVFSKAIRLESRDEDFCPHYKDINPLLYAVTVCPQCGYAAIDEKFDEISDYNAKLVMKAIGERWTKRDFSSERTVEMAIETFKLALLNLQVMKGKNSDIAKVCVRIAWLYRSLKDEKEMEFLKFAAEFYKKAYELEKFEPNTQEEISCIFMIAETNRRLGNLNESMSWFSKVITYKEEDPKMKQKNAMLIDQARELIQLIRASK